LRSPLSAIIGYAELLEMGVPETIPDCAVECVSRIREAANNLQLLVDDLLARPDTTPQLR
jgi:signal transduction histidine kinase